MAEYKLELFRIENEQPVKIAEETVSVTGDRTSEGEENLAIEIAAELRIALQYADYSGEIPDVERDLTESPNRKIDFSDWWDVRNTFNMWLEITNTLADVRFQLAQARAYKAQEPSKVSDRRTEQLKYYAHFGKMHHLNLAVSGLVKIQDLVVRLLFENFGGTLILVDQSDEEWEKKLVLPQLEMEKAFFR